MEIELAKIEAERLLDLLIKHQPGLINPGGFTERNAQDVAEFIEHLSSALIQRIAEHG